MPRRRREPQLSDATWERVKPLPPPRPPQPKGGRPFADDRACRAGIVYALRNGIRRNDMPPHVPSGVTCWRRRRGWTAAGVWDRVRRRVPAEPAAAGGVGATARAIGATCAESRRGGPARAAASA